MSYVAGWLTYYSGDRQFSSKTTAIKDLPQTGMLVWMLYFSDGTRRVLHGNDLYFWFNNGSADGVFANTDESLKDIQERYPGAFVIEGELVSDMEMNVVLNKSFVIDKNVINI